MKQYSTVTVKKVATKEDWLKFRSICTLAGTDATKVIQCLVAEILDRKCLSDDINLSLGANRDILGIG